MSAKTTNKEGVKKYNLRTMNKKRQLEGDDVEDTSYDNIEDTIVENVTARVIENVDKLVKENMENILKKVEETNALAFEKNIRATVKKFGELAFETIQKKMLDSCHDLIHEHLDNFDVSLSLDNFRNVIQEIVKLELNSTQINGGTNIQSPSSSGVALSETSKSSVTKINDDDPTRLIIKRNIKPPQVIRTTQTKSVNNTASIPNATTGASACASDCKCEKVESVIIGGNIYPKVYHETILKESKDPIVKQIVELKTIKSNKETIYKEYVSGLGSNGRSKRDAKQQEWLDWALTMPYDKVVDYPVTKDDDNHKRNKFLFDMRQKLDKAVHGMNEVKEEIMLEVMKRMMSTESNGKILVLEGAPGVGKTFLCRSLSESIQIPYESIAFGSCKDASLLNGHDYTYVGSHPGMIARGLRNMKCSNGLLHLDELDKIGQTDKSREVSSTLLSIIDETQNMDFTDNYLTDLKLNLSRLFVIATVNDSSLIDPILRNRCKIIKLPNPTKQDKIEIIKTHFIPMYIKQYSIGEGDISFDDETIDYILEKVPQEPGVRELKRAVEHIISRFNMLRMTHINEHEQPNEQPSELTSEQTSEPKSELLNELEIVERPSSPKKQKVEKLVLSYSIPDFKLPMNMSCATIDVFMASGFTKPEIDHAVRRMYL